MPNTLFRRRVVSAIHAAKRDFADAAELDHAGLRGRVREIAVEQLIRPFVPAPFEIGSGKIVDALDQQSNETDVVIYSRDVLPPIMYSDRDGAFPAEAVFFAIEVKSCLTGPEVDDAIRKATQLASLTYQFGRHSENAQQIAHPIMAVMPLLFAFTSDLVEQGKNELTRYIERDPGWLTSPRLGAICVVGRGFWQYDRRNRRWLFHPPTEDHDEVVEWLSGIANSLPHARATRGRPRLGNYLMLERKIKYLDGA